MEGDLRCESIEVLPEDGRGGIEVEEVASEERKEISTTLAISHTDH